MPDYVKEIIGLMCRWLLLGLAGLTCILTVWLTAYSAVDANRMDARAIMPDALVDPSKQKTLPIFVQGATRHSQALVISEQPRIHGQYFAWRWHTAAYPRLKEFKQGPNPLLAKGVPYGEFAYQRWQAKLWVLPRERRVFLVDAQLLTEQGPLREMIEETMPLMRIRGQIAAFVEGSAEDFLAAEPKLRQRHPQLPVVHVPSTRAGELKTLLNISDRLVRSPSRNGLTVITADSKLALAAGDERFSVILLEQRQRLRSNRFALADSLQALRQLIGGRP